MAKLMNFMIQDDGIRAELVAQMVASDETLGFLQTIGAGPQKQIMSLFMQMGNPEADHESIFAQLMAIPEFVDNMPQPPSDAPQHAMKIPRIFKH